MLLNEVTNINHVAVYVRDDMIVNRLGCSAGLYDPGSGIGATANGCTAAHVANALIVAVASR